MKYTIQANASGTRSIEISEEHLKTIEKYSLFKDLIPSNGIVDDLTLETLKHNVKSFIISNNESCSDLIDFYTNILQHDNMKVFGLRELILLFVNKQN